jgi:prophage maintenance system killer protein
MKENEIWFPTIEDVKESNKIAVTQYKAVKAERFEVLSEKKIQEAIDYLKSKEGSIEIKASALLLQISDKHPFSSGNRRTAYLMMNMFLWKNSGYIIAKKRVLIEELFKRIRRESLSEEDILQWYG